MKKLNYLLLGPLLLLLAFISCSKDPFILELPPYKTRIVENSPKIYLFEDKKLPTITFKFLFKNGTSFDPEAKKGLAALTTALLDQGTKKSSASEIAEALEFLGASLSAKSYYDTTIIEAQALSKDTETLLMILQDIFLNANFPEEEIKRFKSLSQASLLQIKDRPEEFVRVLHRKFLFKDHPYSSPSQGTIKTLENITRGDITHFYNTYFTRNNLTLAVIGDFDSRKLFKTLKNFFEPWKEVKIEAPVLSNPTRIEKNTLYVVRKPELSQSQIRIGNISINRTDKDYFPLLVANHVLGGAFTSLLNQRIRDDLGLTYDIDSYNNPALYKGDWGIITFTRNEGLNKILEETLKILKNFDQLVNAEELNKAKAHLTGMYLLSMETVEDIAGALLSAHFYGYDESFLKLWRKNVNEVSLNQVKDMAKKYWDIDKLLVTILTNPKVDLKNLPIKGDMKIINYKDVEL